MKIVIGRRSEGIFEPFELLGMHRLRREVFRDRLQWEVQIDATGERDRFDDLDPTYMIVTDDDGQVCGCWRLLPSIGPYMMKDTFPQTLHGAEAPTCQAIWELSRFALSQHRGAAHRFCDLALAMMEAVVAFALDNGIEAYMTVTTPAIERLMRGLGIPMERLGPPVQIGVEKAVAVRLEIDRRTLVQLRRRREMAVESLPLAA